MPALVDLFLSSCPIFSTHITLALFFPSRIFTFQGQEYCFCISSLPGQPISKAHIRVDKRLRRLLKGQERLLEQVGEALYFYLYLCHLTYQRLRQSNDIRSFLVELKEIMVYIHVLGDHSHFLTLPEERTLVAKPTPPPPPPTFYSQLMRQLDDLGWHHVIHIDTLLTSLQLRILYLSFPPIYYPWTSTCNRKYD